MWDVDGGAAGLGKDRLLAAFLEEFCRRAAASGGELSLRAWLDLAEAWRIHQALEQSLGNRTAAARALGIGRRTLYSKMEKLGPIFGEDLPNH